jgi:prepilin-type N-terminal cleavage/methylation domain-containing protein
MRRGFTLLELVVVIIIIGILATLGIQQFGRMAEKARGAEAREILGQIRQACAGYRLERGTVTGMDGNSGGIGNAAFMIPWTCRSSHYFKYDITGAVAPAFLPTDPWVAITATRCGSAGKNPANLPAVGQTLILITDLLGGWDTWTGSGQGSLY